MVRAERVNVTGECVIFTMTAWCREAWTKECGLAESCSRTRRTRTRPLRVTRSAPGMTRKSSSPFRSKGKRAKHCRRQVPYVLSLNEIASPQFLAETKFIGPHVYLCKKLCSLSMLMCSSLLRLHPKMTTLRCKVNRFFGGQAVRRSGWRLCARTAPYE